MSQKIKVEELTIDGTVYVPKESISVPKTNTTGLQCVLIRTYSAGVHYGFLHSQEDTLAGMKVNLVDSRRIWKWGGAFTLSEVANDGVCTKNSRIAAKVNNTLIAIEIIPVSEKAFNILESITEK